MIGRLVCIGRLAAALHQKHVEVRGERAAGCPLVFPRMDGTGERGGMVLISVTSSIFVFVIALGRR
jgi:hypothetical protein